MRRLLARLLPAGPFTGYPIFSVPPELADAVAWAGFAFEKTDGKWVAYGLGNLITRFPDGSLERIQDAVVRSSPSPASPPGVGR